MRFSTGKFQAAISEERGWALRGALAFRANKASEYVTRDQRLRALTPSEATPVLNERKGFQDAMPGAVADAATTTCAKSSLLLYWEQKLGYKQGKGLHCSVLIPTAIRSCPNDR